MSKDKQPQGVNSAMLASMAQAMNNHGESTAAHRSNPDSGEKIPPIFCETMMVTNDPINLQEANMNNLIKPNIEELLRKLAEKGGAFGQSIIEGVSGNLAPFGETTGPILSDTNFSGDVSLSGAVSEFKAPSMTAVSPSKASEKGGGH